MLNKSIDFSKIPFFQFLFYYMIFILGYIIFVISLQNIFKYPGELSYGVYSSLTIQILATVCRLFFLNRDWKSPITIQYIIFGIVFILNLFVLYFLSLLANNVIAILGFFITYFLHLKIIIFIGYKFNKEPEIKYTEEDKK